jgi:hypothetical protein
MKQYGLINYYEKYDSKIYNRKIYLQLRILHDLIIFRHQTRYVFHEPRSISSNVYWDGLQ